MVMPIPGGLWGAQPPEVTSSEFWDGPGAGSMFASAEQLLAVAAQIIANLGGSEAVAAALGANWPDPTGELSVLSAVPHLLWKGTAAGLVMEAAALITATATAFETLKAATPTPVEVGSNQVEHGVLQAHNFLNMLFPAIMANRADYGRMWLTGSTNKYSYAAASNAGTAQLPPMPPPPPSTAGGGGDRSASQSDMPTKDGLGGGMESMMSTVMGPLQSLGGQAGQLTSGGPLQGVAGMGQQLMGPLQQLMSAGGMGNPSDALGAGAANWLTATPGAGGPVAANMISAGGGGGGAGLGGMSALRGPTGWASTPTVNAAAPGATETAAVSRVNEARAALGAPGGTSGMGGTGGMMGPMMHGANQDQNKSENEGKGRTSPLTSLAALYRAPHGVPVITGSGGAVFAARGGGEDQQT
ncbi:PPE domain-containing protein [Mycolicibacterium arenosum]|uniref:PPE family protein n=1 Tax=Mycolicibacterium arenosum TaxID=2952157 RepID=A0ABT1MCL8_9MYCO|nr:PPE domain-containing protein [Mycolicibacterium sp. CAU 1645]MCP9276910.1 PPE family protein [Mycolicibacterium sp. CAU 1645]